MEENGGSEEAAVVVAAEGINKDYRVHIQRGY